MPNNTTNTRENGFETLIVNSLVNDSRYEQGVTTEYNKDYAVDEGRLFRFLQDTQPEKMAELRILDSDLEKDRFFKQLDKKLKSDGVIELLRKGLRYKHLKLDLFYVRPSAENPDAAALYEKNIFSVTRQLQYSKFNPLLALDVCIFLNGLPIITTRMRSSSIRMTAVRPNRCFRSSVASFTLPWTTARSGCVPN